MALVNCKKCGTQVSQMANTCPNCGVKNPGMTPKDMAISTLVLIGIISAVVYACSPDEESLAETQAKEEACKADKICWRDKFLIDATIACKPQVENQAKYSFKWMDDRSMFSKAVVSDNGTISYLGDAIQLQNGFGAFQRASYSCEFDPSTKSVLSIIMAEGSLE